METELLEGVGLSKNEAKIYLAVLRLGSASIGRIAEESDVHRRNVYDVIERLIKKGLVGYVLKGKTKHFQITSPHSLLNMAKEQHRLLEAHERKLEALLPEFLQSGKPNGKRQDVIILRGKESRKIVFEDILKNRKENCCLGGHRPSRLSINYVKQWHKRRVNAGIRDRIIYNRKDAFDSYLKGLSHTEVRRMSMPADTKTVLNIYGSKVAIFLWSENQPLTIWIDNENIADDFRQYFNFLWGAAAETA